jgi:circadian clock protein KaiC
MGQIEKAPTHIPGLDQILEGGLPRGRTTVLSGGPGSGKTLLALEFLYRGALAGEAGIFIGFEEPVEHLREYAATLGWDLRALEREKRLFLLGGHIKPDTLVSGEFSLKGLLAAAAGKSQEMGAKRIAIDALEVALRLFDEPRQVRNEMHLLNDWLQQAGLAVVLTTRAAKPGSAPFFEDFFESMGDCIITLDARVTDQIATRRLRVIKYRGSGFGRNEYPYLITSSGLSVAPISAVGLQHKPLGEKMTTGCRRLDEILDGGYRRASCVLLAGLPGTGKTLLCSTFVAVACGRGERVLYVSFEESEDALVENVRSAGIVLRPHLESGHLRILARFPEAMGVEEHFLHTLEAIDELAPAHVVVDAISACERMGGKQAAFEYLMRLLNACKERGITILMVNQTASDDLAEISGNGISSLVDTVIGLAYKVNAGEITRLLHVLKSRGSRHSNQQHEYVITDAGIDLREVYVGEGEVLTGTARQVQEARDRAEAQRLDWEIQAKELELQRLRQLRQQRAEDLAQRIALRVSKPPAAGNAPAPRGQRKG